MSRTKALLFRGYGWIAAIAASVVLWYFGAYAPSPDWHLLLAALTGILSFAYFVQKQKLDETRLFAEFFARFNERYDALNDQLEAIATTPESEPLQPAEVRVLVDYFNLCGEEYLVWRQGYLPREVWRSWFAGMTYYYRRPRIHDRWDKELETRSYYGLERALR